jgi:hypothetical protein
MSSLALHLNRPFGYTCQPWLSTSIADRYFGSIYRIWFATRLNPIRNGNSSNPAVLYQELDQIINSNDFNHSRVQQLRQRLSNWVSGSTLSPSDIATLNAEIKLAPVVAFRPQLWRIDLSCIHVMRLRNLGQFPDEYLIADFIGPEFEIIVP